MEEETRSKGSNLADKLAKIAINQLEACDKFKQPRLAKILEMEQSYYGKVRPTLKGRSNIPMPFFSKYIGELKAHLDETPEIKFQSSRNAQIITTKKVESLAQLEALPSKGDWSRKDRIQKNLAIFSGVGVYDYFAESDPEYKSNLEVVDIFDFYFEPTGGSDLENHAYVGKGNIFRTKSYIQNKADVGIYDKGQVNKLIAAASGDDYKRIQKTYLNRFQRYQALGLDMQSTNYIGDGFFSLAQWEMEYAGERYFLIFDMTSGIWLRCEKLKDVFKSNIYSFTMWQTDEDAHSVLCKSPADDIYPIAETERIKLNQLIDNSTKRIWGQRAVDPNFFPDPAQLEWSRPDQLIEARMYQGKPISNGVHEFKTDDATVGTIELLKYLDNLSSQVAGVDPQSITNEEQKVGVLYGNLQKVAARLGVYNKAYNECWQKIAVRYLWGLKEHMNEPQMVKIIGENGVEWDKLKKEELGNPSDYLITVVGSNVEIEMSEARKKKQSESLTSLAADPDFKKELNPKVVVEEMLRISGYEEDRIRRIMDVKNYGSETMVSKAASAIEQILKGKEPNVYEGADISFLEYILDFARDKDLKPEQKTAIIQYGQAHLQIAVKNMANKASNILAQQGLPPTGIQPPPTPQPPQQMPQSPQAMGNMASQVMQGV